MSHPDGYDADQHRGGAVRAWVVRAPDVPSFRAFERDGLVGIRGGPPGLAVTEDLTGADSDTLARVGGDAGLPATHVGVLTAFVLEAAEGDAVITPEPGRRPGRDLLLGRFAGGYRHRDPADGDELVHLRPVAWEERLPRALLPSEFWQGRVAAVTEAPFEAVRELLGQ